MTDQTFNGMMTNQAPTSDKRPVFMFTTHDQGATTTLGTIKGEAEAKEAAGIFLDSGYDITVWRRD